MFIVINKKAMEGIMYLDFVIHITLGCNKLVRLI